MRMEGPADVLYKSLCPSLITGVLSQWQGVVSEPVVSGGMCCLAAPWSVAGCDVFESTEYWW